MKTLEQLQFNNTFSRLPTGFYSRLQTTPLAQQFLISFNPAAAELIELHASEAQRADFVDVISGKKLLPGCDPIAACYAGHQFGHYVPRLGDGRAILLGEVETASGQHWDLQLKGAGVTPYSRSGDGRAVLRSTIREYLCSEAMHGLGIPTTRALCIIGSQEEVYRESIEPGAMLLRMAPSHVRFGNFEYYFYTQQFEHLKTLADYVISHFYPQLAEEKNPYQALLQQVIKRTAELIARWQSVGFAHGVMNSDNMSVLGLTLDYGPYGFLDHYDPDYICNHSDHHGRYAFNKQPETGLFNVSCFAQAILPLLDEDTDAGVALARSALNEYEAIFVQHYAFLMRAKLGLQTAQKDDQKLCNDLLAIMQKNQADYTLVFRSLSQQDASLSRDLFMDRSAFDDWYQQYRARLLQENSQDSSRSAAMKQVNPKYILRNYMAEMAIRLAEDRQDYSEIDRQLGLLQSPFEEHNALERYAGYPPEWAQRIAVSCSS
ncbi:MAG: YdiU family protein [Gammaproteobacteria bacterium]|nr:YdiU family protein [Gammaproteobacteria bacterium]